MPKAVATRSRWNAPANPQFKAPMITSAAAVTSIVFMLIPLLRFDRPNLTGHVLILKKMCFTVKNIDEATFLSGK
jgi:hypothetical protein